MSLESQIGDLVAQGGAQQGLVAQLNVAALQAMENLRATYNELLGKADITRWVDATGGHDVTKTGLSAASPYATINRAIQDCPPGGMITVMLITNFHLSQHVNIKNRFVRLHAANPADPRLLTFGAYADPSAGKRCLYRFTFEGEAGLTLYKMTLQMPTHAGYEALTTDHRGVLFGPPDGGSETIFSRTALALLGCGLTIPSPNPFGPVIYNRLTQLYVEALSAPNSILGRLLHNYTNTAGTAASAAPDVFTNLANV